MVLPRELVAPVTLTIRSVHEHGLHPYPISDQGFGAISGLEDYIGCKVLHLESNCLRRIEGLGHMQQLRALFLQSNDISKLEGLEACLCLEHLDISQNPIQKLSGLPPSLRTLHAAGIGGVICF